MIHTGEKPFGCTQCDYKCTQLSNLKNHERIHTSDKPYYCCKCDKSFKVLSSLKRHEKNHITSAPSSWRTTISKVSFIKSSVISKYSNKNWWVASIPCQKMFNVKVDFFFVFWLWRLVGLLIYWCVQISTYWPKKAQ